LTAKEKGNMIFQDLMNKTPLPLSPAISTPKNKLKLDIFIRPWHDEYGNEIALIVHGNGTYAAKDMLKSYSVAGTYLDKEKIIDIMKKYNLHDFEKDGRFFHSKGTKGGFWIFSAFQNNMLDHIVENRGKYGDLLENVQKIFKNDLQPWVVKLAPPMVITKGNEAMWGIYTELSRRIEVSHVEKMKNNKNNTFTTFTTPNTSVFVVEEDENY